MRLIVELLKVAAATSAKIRTRRLDSRGGWLNHLLDRSKRNVSLYPIDAHTHAIARRSECDHYRAAVSMSQAQTAGQNAFDDDFNFVLIEILIAQVLCSRTRAVHAGINVIKRWSIDYNLIR